MLDNNCGPIIVQLNGTIHHGISYATSWIVDPKPSLSAKKNHVEISVFSQCPL